MEKMEWKTLEYIYKEKTYDWYWIVGIVAVSIFIISIILDNLIFGILVLVSAITLSLHASRKPEIISIEVNSAGIKINKTFHPYEDLSAFWIETRDAYPRIIIKSKKKISLYLVVLVGPALPEEIKKILSNHLPEQELSEPLLEKLMFYFGF